LCQADSKFSMILICTHMTQKNIFKIKPKLLQDKKNHYLFFRNSGTIRRIHTIIFSKAYAFSDSQCVKKISVSMSVSWKIVYKIIKNRLLYKCRTKIHFVGLKMQLCWTKNVRLNIRNVGLNWFLSD
jgi:hypothetical protein